MPAEDAHFATWKKAFDGHAPAQKAKTAQSYHKLCERVSGAWPPRDMLGSLIGGGLRRRCAVWINEDAAALGTAAILIDRDCKLRYRI